MIYTFVTRTSPSHVTRYRLSFGRTSRRRNSFNIPGRFLSFNTCTRDAPDPYFPHSLVPLLNIN